jgi:hypothetical protein
LVADIADMVLEVSRFTGDTRNEKQQRRDAESRG